MKKRWRNYFSCMILYHSKAYENDNMLVHIGWLNTDSKKKFCRHNSGLCMVVIPGVLTAIQATKRCLCLPVTQPKTLSGGNLKSLIANVWKSGTRMDQTFNGMDLVRDIFVIAFQSFNILYFMEYIYDCKFWSCQSVIIRNISLWFLRGNVCFILKY